MSPGQAPKLEFQGQLRVTPSHSDMSEKWKFVTLRSTYKK